MPETDAAAQASPAPENHAASAPPASEETETLTASEGVPSSLDAEGLKKISEAAGGDASLAIALALIGLVGAGTTWKFLTQFSEQKHEQQMKRLEIEAQAQGTGAAQPPPCQAATLKLEAEMGELKARLAAVEKKSTSISADFDAEDLERQVKKLTKTVKAMQEGNP
jgi:hypothetical protein